MINHIKTIREQQNLTQEKLASKSQVSRSTLMRLENDPNYPVSVRLRWRIAGALQVPYDSIFEEDVAECMVCHEVKPVDELPGSVSICPHCRFKIQEEMLGLLRNKLPKGIRVGHAFLREIVRG